MFLATEPKIEWDEYGEVGSATNALCFVGCFTVLSRLSANRCLDH